MLGFLAIILVLILVLPLRWKIKNLEERITSMEAKRINLLAEEKSSLAEEGISNQPFSSMPSSTKREEVKNEDRKFEIKEETKVDSDFQPGGELNDPLSRLFKWLAVDWPMKTGAFLLILALGWFVTYAFINDWIGPIGRVSLGLIFGAGMLMGGVYLSKKHQTQGNTFAVVGAITILITILAGIEFYDFFSPIFALAVMLLVIGFLALISLLQKNQALAVVVLILGGVVPGFVIEKADELMIFLYLFILSGGVLWLVKKTQWRVLTILALLLVAFYSFAFGAMGGFDKVWKDVIMIFAFAGLFYLANMGAIIGARRIFKTDLVIAGMNGILFLIWVMMTAPKEAEGMLVLLGALVSAISSYFIHRLVGLKQPVIVYAAIGLMLIVAATALELKGNALTVAYVIEFSTLSLVALYFFQDTKDKKAIIFLLPMLFAIPFLMSLQNINRLLWSGIAHRGLGEKETADLFVLAVIIVASFVLVAVAREIFQRTNDLKETKLFFIRFFAIMGGIYSMIFVWAFLHLMTDHAYTASMVALLIYTMVGLIFYINGNKNDRDSHKAVGGILFGLVVARLLLVEFWQMGIVTKIITFFAIGLMLISTAFIKKNNHLIEK